MSDFKVGDKVIFIPSKDRKIAGIKGDEDFKIYRVGGDFVELRDVKSSGWLVCGYDEIKKRSD